MKLHPQLMFQGDLPDALDLWRAAFPKIEVTRLDGGEGPVQHARVSVAGQTVTLFNSPAPHDFTFTPAISLMVTCETRAEVDHLADILGDGGEVMMPRDAYDFAPYFTWIADRFGVSWQIMVAA